MERAAEAEALFTRMNRGVFAYSVVTAAGGTSALIEMLQDEENDEGNGRAFAADALRVLARDATPQGMIINLGGIAPLVSLVDEGPDVAATAACKALFNLSNEPRHRPAVLEAGTIPPLIALLHKGSSEAKIEAIDTLWIILTYAGGAPALARELERDIMVPMVRFIRDSPECNFAGRPFELLRAIGGDAMLSEGPQELQSGLAGAPVQSWSDESAAFLDDWLARNGQVMVKSAAKG
jgi:hypothetical protein